MSLLFVTFPVIWILGSWLILSSLPEWGWSRRGLARAPGWQQLPFSSASHLLPEGAGCQLSSDPPSRGSRAVGLQVLLVVNSKKNLRNFFFYLTHFLQILLLIYLSFPLGRLPWQRHRVIRVFDKEIMALSTVRKNLALWCFLWATTKLQRWGPDKAFQRNILHYHCVSVPIVSSCFSWCLLWRSLK